jgi:hypothetical protein
MSRNKGHGRNEQKRVTGKDGKGTQKQTREHTAKAVKKDRHEADKKPDTG